MAGPLGTTVFQVPKLGETGFKIDQVNEAKRKQAQQQLEKEVAATGAEKAYMDNAQGLTGIYKQIADAEFQVFQQAAIQYEKTGSAADEARMKQAASSLTYSVTAGRGILTTAGDEYVKNKANGFKDVALSASEASELYAGFVNRQGEVIIKNGQVMVKDGDTFVPATQSTYLQSSVNLNNSFILPRNVKQGTYVNAGAFTNEFKGAISAGTSVADAESRIGSLYDNKLNNKEFVSDVLTSYAINKLGMVDDPSKLSADKYQEIQELASDEQIMSDAVSWYKEQIMGQVAPLWKATRTGGGIQWGVDIGPGTKKNLNVRENINVRVTEIDADGNASAGEIETEAYAGLPTNLQGKGLADAGSQNKYDIHAVAVVDGKLVAKKVVSEGASFISLDSGRKYTTAVEPLLLQEWDALPEETKTLLVAKFEAEGYNLGEMISTLKDVSQNNVTSQGDNNGVQSAGDAQQELIKTLRDNGMSDEDIAKILEG